MNKMGPGTPWVGILRPTWQLIELDRREILLLFIYTIALGTVTASVPFVSQILVNQAAFTGSAPPIVALSVIILGVMLIGACIRLFQIRVSALIAKRTFVRTAMTGTRSLLNFPSGRYEFDDREVANRFFDVMNFQVRFSFLISEVLGIIVFSILGVVLLSFYHPLFLGFSLILLLSCLLVIFALAKRGIGLSYARSSEKYQVAYWISQVAEYRSLLRQSADRKLVYGRTDELATRYVRAYFRYLRLILLQSGAIYVIQAVASAAFFGLGGWLVVQGQLNLGQLVAAEIVLLAIVGSLGRFSFYIDSFYEMAVSASKVSDLTNVGREPNSAPPLVEVQSFRGLEIASPLLNEPLRLVAGDVVALRGGKRSDCSQLLRELALDRSDLVEVHWDCDPALDRASGAQHTLILVRPAVLRMTLAENLALLSDEATIESARSKVLDLPLLTAGEKATADQPLTDLDISMSDRARYAVARTFLANQNVILLDMFFNLMELSDQMAFVQEFRKRFPDKVLIINSFDKEIDPFVTKIVQLREKSE